ncbi:MAG: hypothetical protein OEZ41_14070 [Nitrospirota bacterium]|nr:hypothetical protein [Nitrospirota bacterium]MDH5701076.1 hypothetical protein [Nitrospirota bacterium]
MKEQIQPKLIVLVISITGMLFSLAVGPSQHVLAALSTKDPKTGTTTVPCGADGKCNVAACPNDPDCPKTPDDLLSSSRPAEDVRSSCGGTIHVEAENSTLGQAAKTVTGKYPNFNAAQKAKDPHYFDAHPSGMLATNHGELQGFGITMIQGKWPNPVDNASGSLTDPTLLFFHKDGKKQDDWKIIGMGYTFAFDRDGEAPPTTIPEIPADAWLIHEAGYHHSPGDGGFSCATDDDLKKSAVQDGKNIDRSGCIGIAKEHLKTKSFDIKHGRFWTVHVWFEPGTARPTIQPTDPWCRQSDNAIKVPNSAFFTQGQGQCP